MDNSKRKICIVTANRSEYSRIKSIIDEILQHPSLELSIVVTGSHLLEKYGNTVDEIKSSGQDIDHRIYMELDGNNLCTMAKSIGIAISDLATYFDNAKIDLVLVMGDRYEALSVAVTASTMNIPVAHVQGGEVTGTIDESIRHAITKLSHIHFPANEQSRERIIKMGENPSKTFNVGCPGTDLLLSAPPYSQEEAIEKLNATYVKPSSLKIDPYKPFVLVIQHPVTTEFKDSTKGVEETVSAIKKIQNFQKIILWPNIDAGASEMSLAIRRFQMSGDAKDCFFMKHIPHEIFVNLLRHAKCLIGNSSSGMRESCYFGTPTVNIGTRQKSRQRGCNVIDVGYNSEEIYSAFSHHQAHGKYEPEFLYGNGSAGIQIASILAETELSEIQKQNMY